LFFTGVEHGPTPGAAAGAADDDVAPPFAFGDEPMGPNVATETWAAGIDVAPGGKKVLATGVDSADGVSESQVWPAAFI
jgi:hypothetical protein